MKKTYLTLLLALFSSVVTVVQAQNDIDILFEDGQFKESSNFFRSEKVDFLRIPSTITNGVEFAIVVYKPNKPSPILLMSHGWHMSVKPPKTDSPNPNPQFLTVQVDMRGRKYSTGKQDCNGYELYDFFDAYRYVLNHYKAYISDPEQVYYMGGSGGGGNGFGLVGKFPDLFCSANIYCGLRDYAEWYRQDSVLKEFRDEMDVWIGASPEQNPEAYASRSGITTVTNLLTPLYIAHGETDPRVPVTHSRNYVEKAHALGKQITYLELPGVGTRDHWGNITPEQLKQRRTLEREALTPHKVPQLPEKGKLTVGGYVVTKHFSVFMDSVDSVGEVVYNLKKHKAKLTQGKGRIIWEETSPKLQK